MKKFFHNSDLALTPASVMKAVTTASTLSLAGADKRFRTPVVLRGSASGASWDGDLVVHTVADPTIESENFKSRMPPADPPAVTDTQRANANTIFRNFIYYAINTRRNYSKKAAPQNRRKVTVFL